MLKKIVVAAAGLAAALGGPVAASAAGLTKVADNIYAYVGTRNSGPANSFGANAGIVIGRDGVVVVDTLISAREGRRLYEDIRKVTDKPIRYVVNTHWHLDHSFGNSEFLTRGAVIIAQETDARSLREKGNATLAQTPNFGLSADMMAGTTVASPALSFTDRMSIDLGDETVELIAAGPSHTGGSLVAWIPSKKVLFAGDILFTGYYPYMADGEVVPWVKQIDRLLAMDIEKIVPGHGPLSTKKDLQEMKDYLIQFDREATRLAAAGNAAEGAAELKKLLPQRDEGGWIIGASFGKYLSK